jgi:zinc protease
MEYATIDRIQRDDLVSFYKRYYFPGNIMLAVYGDFSTAEMKTRLDKLFGGWNYQQPVVPPFPDVERKPRPGTYLADKADVEQTFFAVGHLGGILKDKNEPALAIMADILGGGFSSRLFRRVRTQLGYAYNVSAGWGAGYTQPGIFEISGSTKALSTTAALQVVREETERIRTSEVSDQELGTAKDTVLNSFVFNFDTPSKTLSRLIRYEYYGYPKDFIFQYQKAVQAVTKADVLRVAKEYLHPEEFTLVAVGNPKNFGKPLSALGMPVQAIDLTIPQPKAEVAKSDPVSMEKGKALLQRAQAALGGADRLAAVKDTTGTSEVTVQSPDGPMKITQTNRWIAPSYFRQDVTLPFGKMSTYYDGKSGWISSPQGSGPMAPPVLKQAGSEMWRNFFVLILSDRDPARKVNYAGDGVVQISDGEGNAVSLQIDEKTGLPVKETFTSAGPGGAPSQVEERFEDWTEAGGIKVPKKVTVNRGGSKFADSNNVDLKINTGLKVEDISRKP